MKPKPDAPADHTPEGRLVEGHMGLILGYRLAQATVTTNQVFSSVVGSGTELRQVEFTVLALVQANPERTASELAKALAVTPPNITMWLDRLESRGLIERERSTNDRRAQHVRVTPQGARTADRVARGLQEAERQTLSGLSAAERGMLQELLQKVARCRRKAGRTARGAAAD